MSIALPVVDISYGLPAAAGHYITSHNISLQEIEDITVIILASLEAVVSKHKTSLKLLHRPESG